MGIDIAPRIVIWVGHSWMSIVGGSKKKGPFGLCAGASQCLAMRLYHKKVNSTKWNMEIRIWHFYYGGSMYWPLMSSCSGDALIDRDITADKGPQDKPWIYFIRLRILIYHPSCSTWVLPLLFFLDGRMLLLCFKATFYKYAKLQRHQIYVAKHKLKKL
jgi:hypothetical protein